MFLFGQYASCTEVRVEGLDDHTHNMLIPLLHGLYHREVKWTVEVLQKHEYVYTEMKIKQTGEFFLSH